MTYTAFILTGSIECYFVLVGVFEQVLSVVELSSLEPFWDIRDPFGYVHNLEYTPTKHTWEWCSFDDCILKLSALNRILILDMLHTFWLKGFGIRQCFTIFLSSSRVTYPRMMWNRLTVCTKGAITTHFSLRHLLWGHTPILCGYRVSWNKSAPWDQTVN